MNRHQAQTKVDIDESIEMVIQENKSRFPLEKTNGRHTSLYLGGHDGEYSDK